MYRAPRAMFGPQHVQPGDNGKQVLNGSEGKTLQSGKLLINAFPLLAMDVSK